MELTLPGWAAEVIVSPMQHPIDPFSALSLHGTLSVVLGVPHENRGAASPPNFVIQGHAAGVSRAPHGGRRLPPIRVHFLHAAAERLDGFDAPVLVWGAVRRLRVRLLGEVTVSSPPGISHLYLQSETPLILRQTGQAREASEVSEAGLLTALRALQRKHGPQTTGGRFAARTIRCEHVRFETRWSERVRGGVVWEAAVEVDEEAALWLAVGEVLGLGTYVSRGFGRYSIKMIGGVR